MSRRVPAGYERFERHGLQLVVRSDLSDLMREATRERTVYEWAASHPERHTLQGRAPTYAIPLPGGNDRVVVRRNHHGGWFAWRGDRFVFPRAGRELWVSLTLAHAGIPTAPVVAYALYPLNRIECRADVVSAFLPGADLGTAILDGARDAETRREHVGAVVALMKQLAALGAWHPDLNVKNILLVPSESTVHAALLDVDRVRFQSPGTIVAQANAHRLAQSLRKWSARHGVSIAPDEFAALTAVPTAQ